MEEKIIKGKTPMFICDPVSSAIRYANPAAVEAYKYSKKEFSALGLTDIFHHSFESKRLSYVFLTKNGFQKTAKKVHEDKVGNTFNTKVSILPMMYQRKASALIKVDVVK